MRYAKVTTKSSTAPFTASTFKSFAKIETTDDDTLITDYIITGVREECEKFINTFLLTTTVEFITDSLEQSKTTSGSSSTFLAANIVSFNAGVYFIDLPYKPIISVTSVKTYDEDNTETTISSADYVVDNSGRIIFSDELTLNLRALASVKVTYTCGLAASAANIPADLILAMMMQCREVYENISKSGEDFSSVKKIPDYIKGVYLKHRRFNGI